MGDLKSALEQYKRRHGGYPSTEQGLKALVEKPVTGKIPENYPPGGYLKSLFKDSWNHPYFYESPGSHGHPYEITSWGRDGKVGGQNQDEDVHSWEIENKEAGP